MEIEPPSKERPAENMNLGLTGWESGLHTVNVYYRKEPVIDKELAMKSFGELGFKGNPVST